MTVLQMIITIGMAFAMGFFAVEDIREKSISLIAGVVFMIACATVSFVYGNAVPYVVMGCIPGAVAALLSLATRGKVGIGDAVILTGLGLWCGLKMTGSIITVALFLAALLSVILIVCKKATLKTALPFVPFISAGYVICICLERFS